MTVSNLLKDDEVSSPTQVASPIIVALDKTNASDALRLADSLDPKLCRVKVGKELFTHEGPEIVRQLHQRDFEVFLDLKFHDIPNTTAQAVLAAADLGVWMVNVHAMAGSQAMHLAKSKLLSGNYKTLLIAVTVLTSMNLDSLIEIGMINAANAKDKGDKLLTQQVIRLAALTQQSGLDGVVCSAKEATSLKSLYGESFKLVTPGIRLADDANDDQQRICTPQQAIANGSDYLVIGRSITQAADPTKKLKLILDSL